MTMPILSAELRGKLSKLIAMLDAPTEGEVVNAASRINQSLRSEGFLLHDLSEFIRLGELDPPPFTKTAERLLHGMVREALAGAWALAAAEFEFVRDYERRFVSDRRSISQADFDRLEAICRDVRRRTGKRG
jgi:hypothetical protein